MGFTITEKILREHSSGDVSAGDFVLANIDKCLANDSTAPIAIQVFENIVEGTNKSVFDKNRVILTPDHFTPNKDVASAEQCKILRDFAHKNQIINYFEIGRVGIEHCLIPEQGLVSPGEVFIGADSHTCTYGALGAFATGIGSTEAAAVMATGKIWLKVPESIKLDIHGEFKKLVTPKDLILHIIGKLGADGAIYKSVEFSGPIIEKMSIAGRMTLCNMTVEMGAKSGIVEPDKITLNFLKGRITNDLVPFEALKSDKDTLYAEVVNIDVTDLTPQIAYPSSVDNVKPVSEKFHRQ